MGGNWRIEHQPLDPEFYAVVNILINLILNYEKRVETEIRKANNMANVSTGL